MRTPSRTVGRICDSTLTASSDRRGGRRSCACHAGASPSDRACEPARPVTRRDRRARFHLRCPSKDLPSGSALGDRATRQRVVGRSYPAASRRVFWSGTVFEARCPYAQFGRSERPPTASTTPRYGTGESATTVPTSCSAWSTLRATSSRGNCSASTISTVPSSGVLKARSARARRRHRLQRQAGSAHRARRQAARLWRRRRYQGCTRRTWLRAASRTGSLAPGIPGRALLGSSPTPSGPLNEWRVPLGTSPRVLSAAKSWAMDVAKNEVAGPSSVLARWSGRARRRHTGQGFAQSLAVMVSAPALGVAATTRYPESSSRWTTRDPIRPVLPMTAISIVVLQRRRAPNPATKRKGYRSADGIVTRGVEGDHVPGPDRVGRTRVAGRVVAGATSRVVLDAYSRGSHLKPGAPALASRLDQMRGGSRNLPSRPTREVTACQSWSCSLADGCPSNFGAASGRRDPGPPGSGPEPALNPDGW